MMFNISGEIELFKVRHQKTFDTHGSANLTMRTRESRAVEAYVQNIRYKVYFFWPPKVSQVIL